jgi:hypothetical protein
MFQKLTALFIASLLITLFPLALSEKSFPEYITFASASVTALAEISKNSSPLPDDKKRGRLKKK